MLGGATEIFWTANEIAEEKATAVKKLEDEAATATAAAVEPVNHGQSLVAPPQAH